MVLFHNKFFQENRTKDDSTLIHGKSRDERFITEQKALKAMRSIIFNLWPDVQIHCCPSKPSIYHPDATLYWVVYADNIRNAFAASLGDTFLSKLYKRRPQPQLSATTTWGGGLKTLCCIGKPTSQGSEKSLEYAKRKERKGDKSTLSMDERKWLLSILSKQLYQQWFDQVHIAQSLPQDHAAWASREDAPWIAVGYPRGILCITIGDQVPEPNKKIRY
ncbi:hypothetical protein TWF694_008705 [Orbilia ellipsospora]|uniref:LAGLIDADG endonuclease n=1 Tax=Orbilia ellipsospora TaxID=2528407 RepID=A0AAV9XD39_9PEZI